MHFAILRTTTGEWSLSGVVSASSHEEALITFCNDRIVSLPSFRRNEGKCNYYYGDGLKFLVRPATKEEIEYDVQRRNYNSK